MINKLCVFGEVLFDIFPDGSQVLGGAPFNVAWHLQAFDQAPFFISRVGNDPEGIHIRKTMLDWGMDTLALQTDEALPTGIVKIELVNGEPGYDIVEPCAYDNIEPISAIDGCDLLYHGSLALRNSISAAALKQLIQNKPALVFVDVNLRPPWWDSKTLDEILVNADWVKLNTDELHRLYPSGLETKSHLTDFIHHYDLQGVVLTHGSEGAELLTSDNEHFKVEPIANLDIKDTVGAGDAFASIIIFGLKNNWPLADTIERAQQFASAIVQNRGATVNDKNFYIDFLKTWEII